MAASECALFAGRLKSGFVRLAACVRSFESVEAQMTNAVDAMEVCSTLLCSLRFVDSRADVGRTDRQRGPQALYSWQSQRASFTISTSCALRHPK